MKSTVDLMKEEILSELKRGEGLDSIKDRSGEFIDSYLPIYNGDIIKEWADMSNEYDDMGVEEFGAVENLGIIGRMNLDLFLYYSDLFSGVLAEVEAEATLCADCDALVTITKQPYGSGEMAVIVCPNCGESYDTNLENEVNA